MRLRGLSSILAVAALVATGVTFSGAAFTAASANPGSDFATAAVFPSVTLTDPGSPLRGTVALGATTTGAIVSVTIQRSPAGVSTWTNLCTDASSPYACSFDTTGVADGLYDLRATADHGSGTVTSPLVADRRVDNTAPSVTMTDPGSPLSGTISLDATATDTGGSGIASVTIQRSAAGAGTWTDVCTDTTSPYSCSFDTTSVGDALYDFRAIGADVAGNSASSTVSNRRIDNVVPTVSLTDPGANLRGTISLDATASDGGGIANVKIQRSPAGLGTWADICTDSTAPYSCSFDTTSVGDGLYDLRALATDNGGRTNTSTVTNRRVDNTAPTVSLTDPGTPLSGTVVLAATATDVAGSGVVSVVFQRSPAGAGSWTDICTDNTLPYSCSFDTTVVGDAVYDLRAVGSDVAGNSASSTVANRRIDNVAPTVSLTDPGANLRGTISLDATASDGGGIANVKIQRSPAGLGIWADICTDTTSPYSCPTDTATWGGDGLYDLRALATDNGGRTNTSTVANRRVDNTLPTVSATDPGSPLRLTVTLQATASDTGSGVSSVTIQRSPAGAGNWTDVCTDASSPYSCSFDTLGVSDGLYDLRAVAIDVAGNPNTSTTVANRRVDNTAPTVSLTDPGSPISGTPTLTATASDSGSGLSGGVTFQRSPAGAGSWTTICTDASSPYTCAFNTTAVVDGLYDLRATATDVATNVGTSVVANRVIDNDTTPTAADIQTTNGGATQGRPEQNDTVTFTYSEQMLSTSILAGWNGTSTAVTVRINQNGNNDQLEVWNVANTARLPLTNTFVTLNGNFVQSSSTFNATMVQAGASITVTLGAQVGGAVRTENANTTLSWPPSTIATDLAAHACGAAAAAESGAADKDF